MSVDINDVIGIGGAVLVCAGVGLLFGYEWSLVVAGLLGIIVGVRRA